MTITALPTPPARSQAPATFITNADALVAALPTFVTEANALAAQMTSASVGGAISIGYTFSTTTTDSDPGNGSLRLSSATQNTSTTIRTDLLDSGAIDWTTVLDTFDASSSTVKGSIRLVKVGDGTKWLTFNVTARATPSGYRNFTVTNTGSSAASPFANGDPITLNFSRTGDMGATGSPGTSIGGGSTQSGSFTLSVGANYVQKATPTAFGQACTAGDATTFSKGVICSLMNASDYDYAFKDSTGVIRAFIPAWESCEIGLADNSTAAGQWTFSNCRLLGVTAQTFSTTSSGTSSGKIIYISLDSDRTLFLYGDTSCYARVFRKSTNAWAAAVLVRASLVSNGFTGMFTTTNQAIVWSNSSTTAMQTVVLSINSSTDVITVNTNVPTTLAGNWSSYGTPIVVGSTYLLPYGRDTTVTAVRAFTISGTTPTVGTESAIDTTVGASPQLYGVTSTVFLTLCMTGSGATLGSKPYTISGSPAVTLTGGTGASSTATGTFRSLAVGTRWHAIVQTSGINGIVISVSGTTSTHSVATLSSTANQDISTFTDSFAVSTNKTCLFSSNNSTSVYFNILTDTAGTASAGTELAVTTRGNASASQLSGVSVSGNTCKFVVNAASGINLYTIDASGASPFLSNLSEVGGNGNSVGRDYPRASSALGVKHPNTISSTSGMLTIGRPSDTSGNAGGLGFGTNIFTIPTVNAAGRNGILELANGYTSAEIWGYSQSNNMITKVEAAQP